MVDAIANDKASVLRSQKSGKLAAANYKVIWESKPIPAPPIVINTKKFSPETINKLQQALIDAPVGVVDVSGTESAVIPWLKMQTLRKYGKSTPV